MPSQLVVLDESKSSKHPIISVGGVAVELGRIVEVEAKWAEVKRTAGLGGRSIKYSMSWPERVRRGELIGAIGALPLRAVIALLEDFRPKRMKLSPDKEKRGERYVHLPAFEWVLQRLAEPLYGQPESHPHFVAFDLRDDFAELARGYAEHHGAGWSFGSKILPSLQSGADEQPAGAPRTRARFPTRSTRVGLAVRAKPEGICCHACCHDH